MTIASYSDLTTAAANWTSRADLTSRIPEGIVLAEAKINRYLRVKSMVTKDANFPVSAEYVGVPANFGGVKTFYLNTSPKGALEFMPDELITSSFATSGQPEVFCIQGDQFRFGPPPNGSYTATLVYYLKAPALTSTAPINWLIASSPDAYLYGVLGEMAVFAKDAAAAQGYWQLMYQVLDQIKAQSNRDSHGGDAALFTRPA